MGGGRLGASTGAKPTYARIFLAYASEDAVIADAVQGNLERAGRSRGHRLLITKWELTGKLGESTLKGLLEQANKNDFGIFLLTPIDPSNLRGANRLIARDNVVFELGLFTGHKGTSRALMLRPEGSGNAMPSDLAGIHALEYAPADSPDDWNSVVNTACVDAVAHIIEEMEREANARATTKSQAPTTEPAPSNSMSALEKLAASLIADASRGRLAPITATSLRRGLLVVHGLHGIGQVVAFDPKTSTELYVTVDFGSATGVVSIDELYALD